MMKSISVSGWLIRFVALVILFIVFFTVGSLALSGLIPPIETEPGLVPAEIGILIIAVANTLLVMGLVLSSHWSGWKLALWLAFSYYGVVTVMTQVETWYFLLGITVEPQLLQGLFLMGLPVAVFFVPLSVWILGKGRRENSLFVNPDPSMPLKQWLWKLVVIAVVYIVLYWSAGYFIAWQNPELRAFYGSPGDALPFWTHTLYSLQNDFQLFAFQGLRGVLWAFFALPVVRGSKLNLWQTAVLVGLFLTVPVNIAHILANPLIPIASVRMSHMIETASSTFVFGIIGTALLYRAHRDYLYYGKYNR